MKKVRAQARSLNFFFIFLFAFIFLNIVSVFAGPSRTTYQAKIVKPDGYPLEGSNINFKFTILDPAGSCILYSETFSTVNMGSSAGLVSFSLGSGVRTFPVSGSTFEQVFSNTTASLTCDAGGPATYSPAANDTRKIVMQFNDGAGWQTLPAMTINAVPYAMYANDSLKFNGKDITDFVQVASLPTCGSSEAIRFNGVGFSCIAAGGSGTITSGSVITALGYTPADSVNVTALSSNVSSVSSTVFSVSSTVTSLQNSVAASFAAITSSQWTTSGTNIFYNTGNVGIGTANPAEILDATGNIKASGSLIGANVRAATIYGSNVATGSLNIDSTSDSTKGDINIGAVNGNRVGMGGAANANTAVMIRRNNAAYPLLINGATNTENVRFGVIAGTNYYGGMDFMNDGLQARWRILKNGTAESGSNAGSDFNIDRFNDSGTSLGTAFSILRSSGNVGIGTTTPITKLDVSGGVRIGTESTTCAPALAGTLRYNASNVEYCNGTSWQAFGVSGAGITNFNGSTSGTQSLATGTGGTAPNFNTSNGVHTLNIPLANTGSVTAGLLSNADYTTFSNKITSSAASIAQVLGYVPADNAASGTYAQKANNLSDLTNIATARTNLGLGTFATANTLDLGSASATGTLAVARLPSFTGDATIAAASNTIILSNSGVTAGTYTKVTVDSKGRVTSSAALASSDVTTALGYTPANSATTVSSQWATSGTTINYMTGNVGIGTIAPSTKLYISASDPTVYSSGLMPQSPSDVMMLMNGDQTTTGYTGLMFQHKSSNVALGRIALTGSFFDSDTAALTFGLRAMSGGGGAIERMRITADGNVGIGTSAPTVKLDVVGDIKSSGVVYTANVQEIQNNGIQLYSPYNSTNPYIDLYGGWAANGKLRVNTNIQAIYPTVAGGWSLGTSTNPMGNGFFSGNVGIGTTAPTAKLHLVAGTSSTASFKFTSGTLLTSPQSGSMEYDGTNFYLTDSTNTRRAIAANTNPGTYDNVSNINSSGNITLTPTGSVVVSSTTASTNSSTGALVVNGGAGIAGNLNVAGTISGSAKVIATGFRANQGAPDASDSSTNGYAFGTDGDTGMFSPGSGAANGVLAFYSNNTELMRMTASGAVGIGTSTPTAPIEATKNFGASGAANSILKLNARGTASSGFGGSIDFLSSNEIAQNDFIAARISSAWEVADNGFGLSFFTKNIGANGGATVERMRISNSGNVGIGTTSPGSKLEVSLAGAGSPRWNFTSAIDNPRLEAYRSTGVGSDYYGSRWEAGVGAFTFSNAPGTTMGSHVYTERFRIESNGYVGIGTTSPAFLLDVSGTTNQVIRASNSLATVGPEIRLTSIASGGRDWRLISNQASNTGGIGSFSIFNGTDGGDKFVITPAGSVGLGTVNPQTHLHIAGTNRSLSLAGSATPEGNPSYLLMGNSDSAGVSGPTIMLSANRTIQFGVGDSFSSSTGGNFTSYLTIQSGGNVGIGTNTPQAPLDVAGGASAENIRLRAKSSIEGGQISLMDGTGTGAWEIDNYGSDGNERLRFFRDKGENNIVEPMVINQTGNVGIGTTAPTEKLHVQGNSKVGDTASTGTVYMQLLGMHDTAGGSGFRLQFDRTNDIFGIAREWSGFQSPSFVINRSDGNIGIGTTAPTAKLHVSGTARIVDGNQAAGRVLASDASGNAAWKQTIIHGTIASVGNTSTAVGNRVSSGVSITLPPGKWQITGMGITSAASCRADFGIRTLADAIVKYTLMPVATGDFQTATVTAYVDIASTTTYELYISSRGACNSQIHVDNSLWELTATGVAY